MPELQLGRLRLSILLETRPHTSTRKFRSNRYFLNKIQVLTCGRLIGGRRETLREVNFFIPSRDYPGETKWFLRFRWGMDR